MIKNKKNISRANLFLIELIIIVSFFIVSLTITMRIFSEANSLSFNSSALNGAAITMQSNAEHYRLMSYKDLNTDIFTLYYDKNWNSSEEKNGYYVITIEISLEYKDNSVIASFNQNAKVLSNNKHIYNLETKKFYKKDMWGLYEE